MRLAVGNLARRVQTFTTNNSPVIFTAVGVTGALTTALLAARAAYRSAPIIEAHELREGPAEGMERVKEHIKLTWKLYIPAAASATLTVAAIIAANRIGTRRTAAMATAYSLAQRAFEEYQVKVVEKFGERKEQQVRDEIAQDRVTRNPPSSLIVAEGSNVICYEAYTGRYFACDMQTLRKAQNDINVQIINEGFASLSDFYHMVGLSRTAVSDEIGWTTDKLLELKFSTVLSPDDRPCISIDYNHIPVR